MNVSQQLDHINDNNYDDVITVDGLEKGHFIAITSNTLPAGSDTREIQVDIMPLEQAPGGTVSSSSGLYVRGADETQVQVKVMNNGTEVASNTTSYS